MTSFCRMVCFAIGLTALSAPAEPSGSPSPLICTGQVFEAPPLALRVADSGDLTVIPSEGAPILISGLSAGKPRINDLSARIGIKRHVITSDDHYFLTNLLGPSARFQYEIRELPLGTLRHTLTISDHVTAAAFHPTQGLLIATDKQLLRYAAESGELLSSVRFAANDNRDGFRIEALAWNQKGTRAVVTAILPNDGSDDPCKSGRDAHTAVEVIAVESFSRQWFQIRANEIATKVFFAADGESLLYGSDRGLELIPSPLDHRAESFIKNRHTWDLSLSLDRTVIASLSDEHLILFEALTGSTIAKIALSEWFPSGASRVALSPNGDRVALTNRNGQVCLGDTKRLLPPARPPLPNDKATLWRWLGERSSSGFEAQRAMQAHPDWAADLLKRLEDEAEEQGRMMRAAAEPWLQRLDHESYYVRNDASEQLLSALRSSETNFASGLAELMEQEAKNSKRSLETRVKLAYLNTFNESTKHRRAFPQSENQFRKARLKSLTPRPVETSP